MTLATINCALRQPDWSQPSQHFHWDESLDTNDAIHWGDGDLSVTIFEYKYYLLSIIQKYLQFKLIKLFNNKIIVTV